MKKERRWIKSAIEAALETKVALPWARSTRRRPAAVKPALAPKPQALAAR
jgi:hypothetical protein